ncbi:hypothetical protein CRE_28258 [Caenorhabditis remanei]|uniref:Uncharacterized protein n=1 Tax=Caenorhabditis remanei TaxID=31234 RepID=E3LN02_CAERE|nr:hypothetical protein CRE_28258 [Caenorhabditis remanei]
MQSLCNMKLAVIAQLEHSLNSDEEMEEEREPREISPNACFKSFPLHPTNCVFHPVSATHAFSFGSPEKFHMNEREISLTALLMGQSNKNYQPDYGIPEGARSITFVYNGFEFGKSCIDFTPKFQPKEGSRFMYQLMATRVQMTYFEEEGVRRPAAVTWYYGNGYLYKLIEKLADLKNISSFIALKYEEDENLRTIYKIVKEKFLTEGKERGFDSGKELIQSGDYIPTEYSHLKLFKQPDGRKIVLACHPDSVEDQNSVYLKAENQEKNSYGENTFLLKSNLS